ncbi:MAG: AAA family ATPase [Oscillospiraceae bacterium]|nr:AAA family ATPase [Oscillospiraceae bacterium]
MKLTKCVIRQFGSLRNKSFDFGDGITLISGKNESGKSTLHTAITALLFGMEKGKGRAAASGVYRSNLPWFEPDLYGGFVTWTRGEVKVTADRDFSRTPPQSRLIVEEPARVRQISPEEVPFPDGLSPYVFTNTLSFRQIGAATGDGLAADLQNHVMNLRSSGDERLNVRAAADSLKARRKALERRIDTAAEAEDASLDLTLRDLERRTLSEGGDYDRLKAEADARDARIRELTAERERTDRDLRQKEALLTNMGTTSREAIEDDLRRTGVLCEQMEIYERDYTGGRIGSGVLNVLSLVTVLILLFSIFFLNRIIQSGTGLWPLIPLFAAALLAATFFVRLTRQADANAADEKNRQILTGMLSRYLPDYEAQGTLKEAGEMKVYLEKVVQLFDYLAEKRRVFEQDTEELVSLSASREAMNEALNEQLVRKVRREQWELELREAMARKEALKPVLKENERLRNEIAAIARAGAVLTVLAEDASANFGAPLTREASAIFSEITGGAYDGLEVSDSLELFALSAGRKIAPGALSAGAMEQLYFSFRLAVVRCLWPHEEMPLFFDDSFAMYDSERLDACLRWLHENYRGQVFLFTCQDREKKTLDRLGIPYDSFEL